MAQLLFHFLRQMTYNVLKYFSELIYKVFVQLRHTFAVAIFWNIVSSKPDFAFNSVVDEGFGVTIFLANPVR
ncbi:MAG: hypothetical protein ACJLS3_10435 [Erythrobacter sp.]